MRDHPTAPLTLRSASTEAYLAARRLIVECDVLPGEVLTEATLASRLGVGLTPARDALARLRFDRLVSAVPRTGYVVDNIGAADVDEIFQIWSFAGPSIVRLALTRMSRHDRAELEHLAANLRDAPDGTAWQTATMAVFDLYRRCADNRLLDGYLGPVENELRRVLALTLRDDTAAQKLRRIWYAVPGSAENGRIDSAHEWITRARPICHTVVARLNDLQVIDRSSSRDVAPS